MRLTLRGKQKANYSMMYKRWFLICLFLFLFWNGKWQVTASDMGQGLQEKRQQEQAEEESSKLPSGEAEILLIHENNLTSQEIENIALIAEAATCLGRSLDFGTVKQCEDVINDYEYLICYNLKTTENRLLLGLEEYKGNLLILGTELSCALFLEDHGRLQTECSLAGVTSGIFSYSFSSDETFEKLVEMEDILVFENPEYESGTITTKFGEYPFWTQIEGIRYCPLTDFLSDTVHAAFLQELTNWLWPYSNRPADYAQYLVLDEVYSFMPTDLLLEKVEIFVEAGIPFVISVMPVFQNGEYPAMQQFSEVLKYAQANGGAVILHAPLINGQTDDWENLQEQITTATVSCTNWGVYPVGIEVPKSWTYDENYLNFLKRYKTVFIYEDGEDTGFDIDSHKNLLYYNYHQLVMPALELDDTGLSYLSNYSTATYVKATEDSEKIKEQIERMQKSFVPLKSLWDISHSVWADNFHLNYENYLLTINGEQQSLTYEASSYIEDFSYNRNTLERITVSLEKQNKELIILVAVIIVIFSSFIIYARILNRRLFFYDNTKKRKKEKHCDEREE